MKLSWHMEGLYKKSVIASNVQNVHLTASLLTLVVFFYFKSMLRKSVKLFMLGGWDETTIKISLMVSKEQRVAVKIWSKTWPPTS